MSLSPLAQRLRRWVHPLYRRLETDVHPLRYLFVEVTQRCNLACLHCGSDCGKDARLNELTTEEWCDFFDGLPRQFDPRGLMLVVTGGEPLCAPHFKRLVDRIASNGLDWGMVSNGYALNARRLCTLIERRLMSLTISLDGLQKNHDWLRGVRSSYSRALAAIDAAACSSLPLFDVVTCVNSRNLGELDALRQTLIEHRVRRWRLFSIIAKGRAAHDRELLLSTEQLRELMSWIADTRQRHGAEPLSLEFSCEGFIPEKLDRQVRDEPYFCRAGVSIGSVLCDGSVSACPNISRSLIQGNIRTQDLKTIWETRFERFRDRDWMRQGPCQGCNQFARCQGNSLHLWNEQTGHTARCFAQELSA